MQIWVGDVTVGFKIGGDVVSYMTRANQTHAAIPQKAPSHTKMTTPSLRRVTSAVRRQENTLWKVLRYVRFPQGKGGGKPYR